MGDGASWIWNIAEEHFYGAIQIIDLYHGREHYWNVGRAAFGSDQKRLNPWAEKRRKELDQGKVEHVIKAIQSLVASTKEQQEIFEGEIAYFEKNKDRMRYEDFRKQGLFVGSGVVEAGCRTVIGQRLKQSGMHWTVMGANNIIALRCCILSNRWEDFWEDQIPA
jgi:excinuclease UvrABC ATPase subunit